MTIADDDDYVTSHGSPALHGDRQTTQGGNNAFHNFFNDFSHIGDPNIRRRLALSEIDKVPFGLYHIRAILVAGVGFFLDSYDIFAINLVTILLGVVFWGAKDNDNGYGGNHGHLPDPVNQALKASTSAGIVVGMVLFGWLADAYGRRRMYGVELIIIIGATLGCALVTSSPAIASTPMLIIWRVIMGIGIGGDYPLSSVITAEFAPTRWRGAMVAAVFSMQGLGQLGAALVALITTYAFKNAFADISNQSECGYECRLAADRIWRIIVGVGAIPACIALYYRITIPETPRYTFDIEQDVEKAGDDIKAYVSNKSHVGVDGVKQVQTKQLGRRTLEMPRASWGDLFDFFREWAHFRVLLGTTLSWFFLDLAFYGLGLNNNIVLQAVGYGNGDSLYEKLHGQALGMIILTCAGSLPGYCFAILSIDTFGRKPLQVLGFLSLTVIFGILGFAYKRLSEKSILALYIIGQFLFNAGPNTTTFIVPGECFPTRYRASGHGLSAAMGKVGAIIAQGISIPIATHGKTQNCKGVQCNPNLNRLLQLFALFMLLGTLVSLLIPETKGRTLEELSGEAKTSYNAGCNGSISLGEPKMQRWNFFAGGQPAGFQYSRSGVTHFTRRRKADRIGIMTSPELVAQTARYRKARFWRHRKARPSDDNQEIALSTRSSGVGDDHMYGGGGTGGGGGPSAMTAGDMSSQPPPTWGAGWGRIDRGGPAPMLNSVQLQDVGMLLSDD